MKDLKFRYFLRESPDSAKKMYYGELPEIVKGEDSSRCKYIMQYIGLKDANNIDIYEDDIIKHANGNTSVVKFDSGRFYLFPERYGDAITDNYHLTVIGNIHKNPEYLNETI
jgi:hypothetical protein